MKKVLLVGPGGAGKSTLARQLSKRTGLPCIHLDALHWKPGWRAVPREEWARTVQALLARPEWIIDGNYSGTLEMRLKACDTVIFLDLPPLLCLWRIVRRRMTFHGRARPDAAPGCPERLDIGFALWVLGYRRRRRPALLARLKRAQAEGTRVLILRTPREVERFIESLPALAPS